MARFTAFTTVAEATGGGAGVIDIASGQVILGFPRTTCELWVARRLADQWNAEDELKEEPEECFACLDEQLCDACAGADDGPGLCEQCGEHPATDHAGHASLCDDCTSVEIRATLLEAGLGERCCRLFRAGDLHALCLEVDGTDHNHASMR